MFTDGGTLANTTALWVARNAAFKPKNGFNGIENDGLMAAYKAYGVERAVVMVSRLGHYSLRKACGLLGIGNQNLIPMDVDNLNKVKIDELKKKLSEINKDGKTKLIAIIGIAGTTETGAIDPLPQLAEIASENNVHFHVDAAWGDPR